MHSGLRKAWVVTLGDTAGFVYCDRILLLYKERDNNVLHNVDDVILLYEYDTFAILQCRIW